MKKLIILIYILLNSICIYCQTNLLQVITSSGDYFKPDSISFSLSWTLGECITENYISAGSILTQGFQQGHFLSVTIDEIKDKDLSIIVFPNPTTNFITIYIMSLTERNSDYLIELYDLQGKMLNKEKFKQDKFQLDMFNYPAGIYLLKVMTKGNKSLQNFKIQKTK